MRSNKANKIRAYSKLSALALAACLSVSAGAAVAQAKSCENVATSKGPISGKLLEDKAVCAFLGVPFAAAPVGELRFARPAEPAPWTQPLEAVKVGSQCPQSGGAMVDKDIPMSEDCLYLNVWQPVEGAKPKPVMVYIHGGGFIFGSGGSDTYNGANLAQAGDVIVVTMNYRLGALGFLGHPALTDKNGRTGNWGLYDQLAALKWVKANAANFGGDPENITLFGQSAGSMSVGFHLASPLAAGLFKNAMLHSGPPTLLNVGLDKAKADGLEIAKKLGCTDPDTAAACLRRVDSDTILRDVQTGIFILDNANGSKYFLMPVVDGEIIPDAPYRLYRDGKFNTNVNVVIGTTKEEAAYFTLNKTLKQASDFTANNDMDMAGTKNILGIDLGLGGGIASFYPVEKYPSVEKAYQDYICDVGFTCPLETLADLISKRQPNTYRFFHTKDPVRIFNWGAFHGSELPYIFGNFSMMGRDYKSKDNLKLAKKMTAIWSMFAWTGAPQVEGLPEWPRYDAATRKYLVLGDTLSVKDNLKHDKCSVLDKVFSDNFAK